MLLCNCFLWCLEFAAFDHLGPRGKALYEEACKKGTVRLSQALLDVMGEEEAGKSCFIDSILDLPFEDDKPSTEGVKIKTVVMNAVVYGDKWKQVKVEDRQEEMDKQLAIEYHTRREQQSTDHVVQTDHTAPRKPLPLTDLHSDNSDVVHHQQQIPVQHDSAAVASSASQTKEFDRKQKQQERKSFGRKEFSKACSWDEKKAALFSRLEKNKEELRKCEEMVIINVMDRGGQEQFLSIHAALMADTTCDSSVCCVVLDPTKPLDDIVKRSLFRLGKRKVKEQKRDVLISGAKFVQYFASAINAAYPATLESLPEIIVAERFYFKRIPAVFMVATRKDKTKGKGKKVEKQEKILQDIIKTEPNFVDHVVFAGQGKVLFHVDNKKSGTSNPDPVVVDIKRMIAEIARRFSRKIPLPWAMLGKGLCEMALSNLNIIDIQDVYELAKEFCEISSNEECIEALRHLCSLGSISFYHNVPGLKEKVLPSTQWAANVMSVFVTVLTDADLPSWLRGALKTLQDEGLMTWELAKYLLDKAGVKQEDHGVILLLLKLFNIISPALKDSQTDATVEPGCDFFVPCMVLKDYTTSPPQFAYHRALCSPDGPPPLFLTAKGFTAFLKPLFSCLGTRMIAKYGKLPKLSRNQVILHVTEGLDLELVYDMKAVIVTLYCPPGFTQPSDLGQQASQLRVVVAEQLIQGKRRGMDGFQFEICVHPTVAEAPTEVDYDCLASLDEYPDEKLLVNRHKDAIVPPANLDLWYFKQEQVSGTMYNPSLHFRCMETMN